MANPFTNLYIRKEPRVPTLFAFITIFVFMYAFSYFFARSSSRAKANYKVISSITIANLVHNQATIIWESENKETGWILYGESAETIKNLANDERDLQSNRGTFRLHYVTLKNLKPNTKYFFYIMTGKTLGAQKDKKPFVFKTTQPLAVSKLSPAYGKVILANGRPLVNGLVTLSFSNSLPLSALTKISGEWLIPLSFILDKRTKKQMIPKKQDTINIQIAAETKEKTIITTSLENISPLPQTVILGKNYRFSGKNDVLSSFSQRKEIKEKVVIVYPKRNALIPASRPLVQGLALPGAEVIVEIESEKRTVQRVKADEKGRWRVIPLIDLSPGKHKVTVITKDEKGNDIKLTREFSIAKSGEAILGEATGEPTPTGLPLPTATPTIFVSPTVEPTMAVSVTLTPTEPVSGGGFFPFILTSTSFIVVGIGLLLAF